MRTEALTLHARAEMAKRPTTIVARVTRDVAMPADERGRHALLLASASAAPRALSGFAAVLSFQQDAPAERDALWVRLPPAFAYLEDGDIVLVDPPRQHIDVLYRRNSPHNSLLLTERCNSRCLMCSQPPMTHDDSYLVEDLLRAIPLMSPDTNELGFTGGETALLHDGLIRLIAAARDHLPNTALHLLSNGRLFAYLHYAGKVAQVGHPDLMIGIPVYSDLPDRHDFVVQARGAFDQTIRGILNLGRYRQQVEVRVVLHRQTYERLPQLARFIARNLPFVSHIALMGLEMTGYTRANLEALWIDPVDYQGELNEAVALLDQAGLNVSIYNHQLCLLDVALWPFARKSISDWKNIYMPECEPCAMRDACGGFFASAILRHSGHIRPIASTS
jgi:His-Xaa-Ser system radical SAM maturase HxsC